MESTVKPPGALRFFGEDGIDIFGLEVTVEKFDPSIPFTSYPKVKEAMDLFPEALIFVAVADATWFACQTRPSTGLRTFQARQ